MARVRSASAQLCRTPGAPASTRMRRTYDAHHPRGQGSSGAFTPASQRPFRGWSDAAKELAWSSAPVHCVFYTVDDHSRTAAQREGFAVAP